MLLMLPISLKDCVNGSVNDIRESLFLDVDRIICEAIQLFYELMVFSLLLETNIF